MSQIIDISVSLHSNMPIWPNSAGIQLTQTMSIERKDPFNNSSLTCDVHIGTHIDAPRHFIKDGTSIEHISLDTLIGQVFVAYIPGVNIITAEILSDLSLPLGTKRLLLRTSNSVLWEKEITNFSSEYVALTNDAAKWIVEHGIRLIGIDYLSIQCYNDNPETHKILLGAGVIILEGLNLANVASGEYELICLPLKLVGSDGAPARAVLRRIPEGELIYEK
ncbi:MAG: cyclase family protein [Candidatus Methanoperedens sp.]|nr:cyclase family protein [Candidatus Methanoperedens sp.]CAG0969745.1 arylformamidase [Methanosarcinales archaeon]